MNTTEIIFACPACHSRLQFEGAEELVCTNPSCPAGSPRFPRLNGIWRCMLPKQAEHFKRFIKEYETVRRLEGRGDQSAVYFRALPYQDLSGRFSADWKIRARSYRALLRHVVARFRQPLTILDLGAGNGWLSARLSARGHQLVAVDLLVNRMDGLGAWEHYPQTFTLIQAPYSQVPLESGQAELVIYNASLHYAENLESVLREGLRLLKPEGSLVVMDSPVYHDRKSGEQMVSERRADFSARFGFPSDALESVEFLTYKGMHDLGQLLGIEWRHIRPYYGLHWEVRPWLAKLRGSREPAEFGLWVSKRK